MTRSWWPQLATCSTSFIAGSQAGSPMDQPSHSSPAPLDLSTCDREPIHIPGAIQPHGFLIALDAATGKVTHASENVRTFFGRNGSDLLGRSVNELFPAVVVSSLRQMEEHPLFSQRALFVAHVEGTDHSA